MGVPRGVALFDRCGGPSLSQRRGACVGALLLVATLVSACGQSVDAPEATVLTPLSTEPLVAAAILSPTPPAAPSAQPSPTATFGSLGTNEQERVDALLAEERGVYGVVILDSDGNVLASRNSTMPFITASLYKLILIADIYRRIELGELSLDQKLQVDGTWFAEGGGDMYFATEEADEEFPIRDLLFAAGAFSSNAAARTLLPLTDPESLRATAESIGMERTYLLANLEDVPYWPPQAEADGSVEDAELARRYVEDSALEGPFNITTPLDMATYMFGLTKGTVISPWVSQEILTILEEQLVRDRIPFYMRDVVPVINKPGNLEDVVNDTGVLFLPEGGRAVAFLSEAVPDDSRATLVLQRLTLIASGSDEIPPVPDSVGTPASDWVEESG